MSTPFPLTYPSISPPPSSLSSIQDLFSPHVDSFNAFLAPGGLFERSVASLPAISIDSKASFPSVRFWLDRAEIGVPTRSDDSSDNRIYPNECRELGISYTAPLLLHFHW